jgi:hypothetical protein
MVKADEAGADWRIERRALPTGVGISSELKVPVHSYLVEVNLRG